MGRSIIGFDISATELLQGYSWPGNIRQLKNVIKRATLLANDNYIKAKDLNIVIPNETSRPLFDREDEKSRITDALRRTGNNKSKAAAFLGIDRKTLYNKLRLFGIK